MLLYVLPLLDPVRVARVTSIIPLPLTGVRINDNVQNRGVVSAWNVEKT